MVSSAARHRLIPSAWTIFIRSAQLQPGNFIWHYGDLTDASNLTRILQEVQPDEVYNSGAMSYVAVPLESPEYTADGMMGHAAPAGGDPLPRS